MWLQNDEILKQRVSALEDRADGTGQQVKGLEQRMSTVEGRVEAVQKQADKADENQKRLWERFDQHRDGLVRTQTLVETVGKDVTEVRFQVTKLSEAQSDSKQANANQWGTFWEKAFYLLAGAAVAIVVARFK